MENLGIRGMGRSKMLLETRARSLQHVFSRLSKAVRQRCDVRRGGTCAKPNCFSLLPCKPLTRKSSLAITGGCDKNDVSALSLVEKGHEPWPRDQPMAPRPFATWFCFPHANPRAGLPSFPSIHLNAGRERIRIAGRAD